MSRFFFSTFLNSIFLKNNRVAKENTGNHIYPTAIFFFCGCNCRLSGHVMFLYNFFFLTSNCYIKEHPESKNAAKRVTFQDYSL